MELAWSRFQEMLLFLLTILFLQLEAVVYILSLEIELISRSYSLEVSQIKVFVMYCIPTYTADCSDPSLRHLQYLLGCSAF